MAERHEKLIEDLAKAMIEHSIATLDAFDELPEDASKEDQGKVLGTLGMTGFLKIGSVLAAYGIDLVKILNSKQGKDMPGPGVEFKEPSNAGFDGNKTVRYPKNKEYQLGSLGMGPDPMIED